MEKSSEKLDLEVFLGILRLHLRYIEDGQPLQMQANLYDLGLDSMAAVNLLLAIEDHYGVIFPDAYLSDATFETPVALQSVLLSLM